MKYIYANMYCSYCRMITKWRREAPKGDWKCMNCYKNCLHWEIKI